MSLSLINVTKRFDDKILFSDLSINLPDVGIFALVGESGIGKTTLLRIIAGLDKDYTGEVVGGGIGRVSMSFQEYRLFPQLTALDNLIFAISDGKDEAAALKCRNMLYSLGFSHTDMSLLPCELSGGMKQRVSVARAFIRESDILLLDEPTKELDTANAEIIRKLILEESKKRLVIFVSHNEDDLSIPDTHFIQLKQ